MFLHIYTYIFYIYKIQVKWLVFNNEYVLCIRQCLLSITLHHLRYPTANVDKGGHYAMVETW